MNEAFPDATTAEVDITLRAAAQAFHSFRKLSGERRATFLETIADILESNFEEIISLADRETSLGLPRLGMELKRTANETRLFAGLARSEDWLESRSDEAETDRIPIPKPAPAEQQRSTWPGCRDRGMQFPLGHFGCRDRHHVGSNGRIPGDSKGASGHPGTCAKLSEIVKEAAKTSEMPSGTFSLLQGKDHRVSHDLVGHPLTRAVAFTGS